MFTFPGETVLDPFLGSGTTAVACLRLRRWFAGIEVAAEFLGLAIQRIGAELVAVVVTAQWFQFSLDLVGDPVDRSEGGQVRRLDCMEKSASPTLVHRERKYFFVGSLQREVVFSVVAESLDEAWRHFRSSSKRETPIFSVIKTETEIYLAQGG